MTKAFRKSCDERGIQGIFRVGFLGKMESTAAEGLGRLGNQNGHAGKGSLMKPGRSTRTFWTVSGLLAAILMVTGFALVFAIAVSPLWGWHWFFGWSNVVVLAAVLFDSRAGYWAALKKPWEKGQRRFACYLLALLAISLGVNIFVSVMGSPW